MNAQGSTLDLEQLTQRVNSAIAGVNRGIRASASSSSGIDPFPRFEPTPTKTYSGRSETEVVLGDTRLKAVGIVFQPGDGTGNDNTYQFTVKGRTWPSHWTPRPKESYAEFMIPIGTLAENTWLESTVCLREPIVGQKGALITDIHIGTKRADFAKAMRILENYEDTGNLPGQLTTRGNYLAVTQDPQSHLGNAHAIVFDPDLAYANNVAQVAAFVAVNDKRLANYLRESLAPLTGKRTRRLFPGRNPQTERIDRYWT